jgi:transposase
MLLRQKLRIAYNPPLGVAKLPTGCAGVEELESSATEDEIAAEKAAAKTTTVASFTRKRPARKPFPEHLPRERVIVPRPTTCQCCGGNRLRKLGETITETLESIPRQWKVIQHVREKFTCRDCEKISQAPEPFHVIARGLVGPSLLAMILFEKFGQHQPLNRQAERYAKEGVPLSLSTLAEPSLIFLSTRDELVSSPNIIPFPSQSREAKASREGRTSRARKGSVEGR